MNFFYSTLTSNKEKHRRVWRAMFRSSKWASTVTMKGRKPVLLGHGLREVYNNTGKPAYIVLTTGDKKGGTYEEDLLDSLRPHEFNPLTMEVLFKDSNIILNISQPVCNRTFTTLSPGRLFSLAEEPCSASLHWTDSHYKLREIGTEDIAGLELNRSKDVSMICGLVVRDPEDPQRRQFQDCFQDLMCPPVNPIQYDVGYCLRWELVK